MPSTPSPARLFASALVTVATLALPSVAHANVESMEYWAEFGARLVPIRRLRLTFTENVRFSEYGLRRVIPELEVDYRVVGPLRLGVGYRYLWRRNGLGDLEQGHRLHFDASAQWEWRRIDVEFRSRVQWRTVTQEDYGVSIADDRSMWRNRINVEFHLPGPFTANVFGEHWTRIDPDVGHDRWRVGAGFAVQASRWQFRVYYMRDMPSFIDEPNVNMLGLSARWTLDMTRP